MQNEKKETVNAALMKQMNAYAVVRKIVRGDNLTRAQIAEYSKLTKSTVSELVSGLISLGLVYEKSVIHGKEGRPGRALDFDYECGKFVSIIIEYSSVSAYVANLKGDICFSIEKEYEEEKLEETIIEELDIIFSKHSNQRYGIVCVAIGIIGSVNNEQQVIYSPLQTLLDNTLKSNLEKKYKTAVYIDKQGNLLTASQGIHARTGDVCKIAINIHSVVDMGAIINDELYKGIDGLACELGHMIIVPNGRKCLCGNKGCVESYLSNKAVIDQYFQRTNVKITLQQLVEKIKDGEKIACEIYEEFIFYLSVVINNVIVLFNPKQILINSYIVSKIDGSEQKINVALKSKIVDVKAVVISEYDITNYVFGTCNIITRKFVSEMVKYI